MSAPTQDETTTIPTLKARTLKIEEDGDRWNGGLKPKIRLKGLWLEQAGFRHGHRVEVKCVARGIIELRFADAMAMTDHRALPSSLLPG